MPLAFVLLLLAIGAVWLPVPRRAWPALLRPWCVPYLLAVACAVAQGFLQARALAALALLAALGAWAACARGKAAALLARALLLAWCAALSLHLLPGFDNPVAIDGVRFASDTRPFTQHLNFDKGSAGLVLLALLAPRLRRGDPLRRFAAATALAWAATTVVVLGLALAAGTIRPDPKWPAQAPLFLAANLFFACAAEQALFRTLLHDPLRGAAPAGSRRAWAAALACALLFGLAHAAGGPWMVLLAGLAGLGHAWVYERTGRIEAPILVHFGLNATHFLAFSYPALQGG